MTSGSALAGRHVHLSAEERVARGKAARTQAPRSSHGTWQTVTDRPDPVALLEEQAAEPGARAGPDPLRADARLAVRVLPRRGVDHGGRPGRRLPVRGQRPALRRRAPVELRRVRLARAAADVRHQRLRRNAPRPVGVGREAARGELRGPRPRPRLRTSRSARDRRGRRPPSTGRRCARLPTCRRSTPGTTTWTPSGFCAGSEPRCARSDWPRTSSQRAEKHVAKARTRDSMRVFAKRADEVDGELRIVADPPLIVPIDDLLPPGTDRDEAEEWVRSLVTAYRRIARRPPPPDRGVRVRPHGTKGRGRG